AVAERAALLVELRERAREVGVDHVLREVQGDVPHARRELLPQVVPERIARVFLHCALHAIAERVVALLGPGGADDAEPLGEQARGGERVHRRHELLRGQVSGGPEDDEEARIRAAPDAKSLEQRVRLLRQRGQRGSWVAACAVSTACTAW